MLYRIYHSRKETFQPAYYFKKSEWDYKAR